MSCTPTTPWLNIEGARTLVVPRVHSTQPSALQSQVHDPLSMRDLVLHSGVTPARPQVVRRQGAPDVEVWPEYWGMTVDQIIEFVAECREDEDWSDSFAMHDLVTRYVKPKTARTGLGYALLVNAERPLEVLVMVSHCWAENVLEFLATLRRSVRADEAVFVCAFSLYQCEDGFGPSIEAQLGSEAEESPFHRVLSHIDRKGQDSLLWRWRSLLEKLHVVLGMVALILFYLPIVLSGCVPIHNYCAVGVATPMADWLEWLPIYSWNWTLVPLDGISMLCSYAAKVVALLAMISWLLLKFVNIYRGRMIALPNHEVPIYTRLWCVYEMFVASTMGVDVKLANTLAFLGHASAEEAECSNKQDEERIRGTIEEYGKEVNDDEGHGYDLVDAAIRRLGQSSYKNAIFLELFWGLPLALSEMCTVRLLTRGLVGWWRKRLPPNFLTLGGNLPHLVLHRARLGYDLFCEHVFEETNLCPWVWGLVVGVLAGYAVIIFTIVHGNRYKRGITDISTWCLFASIFVCIEVASWGVVALMKVCGFCTLHWVIASWFMVGWLGALAQGTSFTLLFVLMATCCGHRLEHMCACMNPLAFLLLTFLLLLVSLRYWPGDDILMVYPTFVFNGSLIFGCYLGPILGFWTAARRWGIHIRLNRRFEFLDSSSDDENLRTKTSTIFS